MKDAENSGVKGRKNFQRTKKAPSSPAHSECSEMSSLIDPAMVSDDDIEANDEKHATNDMKSEVVSKFKANDALFLRF